MEKKDLRIVYMGTPDFAVEPLRKLVEGGYNIVGCITMPDKPAGRGHKIQFSPVKEYAIEKNILSTALDVLVGNGSVLRVDNVLRVLDF